jgi:parallel beta-helix repeat protein
MLDLLPRRALVPALLSAALLLPAAAAQAHGGKTITVKPTGSTAAIQAAVDVAHPGDTILVRPGVYSGPTVRVNTSGLTIRGSRAAVIDASGQDFGLTVGPAPNIPPDCGSGYGVSDFTIDGLTIRNADDTGIFLMGVNRFRVTNGSYLNNGEYGIFPRCSRDGLVDHNSGGGGADATIYVGVDKNIRVEQNVLTNGVLGIELEDTDDTYVRNNVLTGNTVGVFVIVLPGLPTTSTNRATIENNIVLHNNLTNTLPAPTCDPPDYQTGAPGCIPLEDDLQLLPSGSGILNVGGDDITIRKNLVTGNNTVGVGVVQNPFGFGTSNNTRVQFNVVLGNGKSPDPRSSGSGDLVYLDDPTNGSCISQNIYKTTFYPFGAPPACS